MIVRVLVVLLVGMTGLLIPLWRELVYWRRRYRTLAADVAEEGQGLLDWLQDHVSHMDFSEVSGFRLSTKDSIHATHRDLAAAVRQARAMHQARKQIEGMDGRLHA